MLFFEKNRKAITDCEKRNVNATVIFQKIIQLSYASGTFFLMVLVDDIKIPQGLEDKQTPFS